jgi:ABC-type nitrate/sulfonate/bicarbonate transport system substrate-binding protein
MNTTFKSIALGAVLASFALTAQAEDVTIRYLASQGGLNAHELAAELGYFDGTGIKLENVGYAQGGPASFVALAGGSVDLGSAATAAVLNSIAAGNDFVAADLLGAVAAKTLTKPLSAKPWSEGKLLNMALTSPEMRSFKAPALPL